MSMETLAAWVRSHSHEARVEGGRVLVGIAWWNAATGEEGLDWFSVSTLAEAREVLGY